MPVAILMTLYCAIMLSVSAGEDRSSSEKVEVKVDGQSATGTVKSDCVNRLQRLRCCLRMTAVHLRKALWGVTMVICICASWSGCTQLAKITIRRLNVPFTLTWFSTSWNCAIFPLYYLGHLCCSKDRQTPRQRFRWDRLYFLSCKEIFLILWLTKLHWVSKWELFAKVLHCVIFWIYADTSIWLAEPEWLLT